MYRIFFDSFHWAEILWGFNPLAKGQTKSKPFFQADVSSQNEETNSTCRLVFVCFLEEIEGTKKTFRNYLTFSSVFFIHNGIFLKASLLCNSVIFVSMQSVCNISSKKKLKNERSVRSAMGQIYSNDWDNCFLSCY